MFTSALREVQTWGSLVKFSHTIFALPFALSMLVIVWRERPISGAEFAWILLALVSARTAAMAFNRLCDQRVDALNPRTRERELPAGKLSPFSVTVLLAIATGLFVASAAFLGEGCLKLSPLVLLVLFGYSWTKRFTSYSHLVLGLALALAPGGVWYALTQTFAWEPVWLMLGVLFWVGGFDILYACQDEKFDRTAGLHSLPVRLGIERALTMARIFHALSFACLLGFGFAVDLGPLYFVGLGIFGLVLASQHRLVSAQDLSRVDAAFFTRNGFASVIYLAAVALDVVQK